MTYESFVTILRLICIANDVDLRISGSDYYLISNDREIQVSNGCGAFSNDVLVILKNIDIISCPYKYAYDSVERSVARIYVPLRDFKNKADAQKFARWMVNTVSEKTTSVSGWFRNIIQKLKDLI